MVFFSNAQGTITEIVSSPVHQGSNNANEVIFVGPFVSSSTVTVSFILPNGVYIPPSLADDNKNKMTIKELTGIEDGNGNNFNAWTYLVPEVVTEFSGVVTAQFKITNGNIVTATASSSFNVQKGVPNVTPEPSEDIYQQILSALSGIQQSVANLETEKLDKVTSANEYNRAYIVTNTGENQTLPLSNLVVPYALAQRDNTGNMQISDPTLPLHAATKQYTDEIAQTLTENKLNKIDSDINRLYSTTPNNPNNSIAYTDQPNGGTIVQRTLDGRGKFSDGIENNDAATYGQTMELLDGIELVKTGDLQYQLTVNGKSAGTIDIPKDQFLKSVSFDPETNVLTFVFSTSDGDVTTEIDLTGLIDTYTAGDGLNLVNGKFSVKLDGSANNALVLTPNGLFVDKTQFESAAAATEKWEQQAQVNAGKLDKVTDKLNTMVYGINPDGEQIMLQTSNGSDVMPAANSIPRYNNGGYLVSLDINEETAGPNTLTPKGYVDGIKEDIDEQLSFVPRAAANNSPTSGESVTVPNTPATQLRAQDYGTIFTHKRLWDGNLYDEGFNQLVDPEKYSLRQDNGVTWTKNEDGSLSANGVLTERPHSSCYCYIRNAPFEIGHKYFLRDVTAQNIDFTLINQGDAGGIISITAYQDTAGTGSLYASVVAEEGDSINKTLYPQLVDLTAFENATGKTINTVDDWNALYPDFYPYVPTISPETPLEIVPSGNKSNVVSSGKNLFDYENATFRTPIEKIPNGFKVNVSGTQTNPSSYIPVTAGERITVSWQTNTVGQPSSRSGQLYVYSLPDAAEIKSGNSPLTFTVPAGVYNIGFILYGNATDPEVNYTEYTYIQFERGDIATSYVPYVEPVTTEINYTAVNPAEQSLIDNAVTIGVGDYASERNGNTVSVRTGIHVFNGTEVINVGADNLENVYRYSFAIPEMLGGLAEEGYCSHFKTLTRVLADEQGVVFGNRNVSSPKMFYFYALKSEFPSIDNLKSYLAAQYAAGTPVIIYYTLETTETVEIEEIAPIPTFGNNDTTFTSEAVGTSNAPVELDLTTYIAKNLPKGYSLLKDKDGNLIVSYTQTNMLYDVNTDKYMSDLINLKDTTTGTVYKITVTNGAIALVALPAETEETI